VGGTGYGGAGGDGVTGTGFKLTNAGYVRGGYGGYGYGIYGQPGAGVGGAGGAGVSGSGFYVSNANGADIRGGDGGDGYAFGAATGGAGGAGIAGSGVTLVNSGFIAGGRGGNGYTYVSGTQSSGYVSTGGAAGAGVSINNAAGAVSSITNTASGVIVGGESAGTAYEYGEGYAATSVTVVANGGMGGAGISIAGAGTTTVTNAGYIGGGYGGPAYVCDGGYCSAYTGNGGKGGDGISVAGNGTATITNTGSIHGGYGGWAWSEGYDGGSYVPGVVGTGGAGINVSSMGTTTIDNSGHIYGGRANYGYGSRAAVGGAGVTGTGFKLTNSGGIYGGYGYYAGSANGYEGGAGGAGVSGSGFTVTNTGTIGGGEGGSVRGYYSVGAGGAGGVGVSGSAFTLTNSGTVEGGVGGGVYSGCGPALGTAGLGGVGIDATGRASVITSGSIMGGLSGDGTTQADAADFSGGGNSLTLESGYSFVGNVVSSSGTTAGGDTLALGGTTDDTFDVSQIVAAAPTAWTGAVQYYGFANYAKVDGSTWTLTNTTSVVTPWTLEGGTLAISSDTNLGAPSGGLTFNGGTLENTAAITTARPITVQGTGTLQNDADFTSSGTVSGAGALTKTGTGTLTFNGNGSAFSGSTNVTTGTLLVGGDGFPGASLGGATTVAAGATVGGFGTLGSLDLFGNLSPGASIGTLHATGDATFEPGSAYLLDVSPAGQSDLFAAKGVVTIHSSTIEVQPSAGTWAPITKYTIVTGQGGVSGTFAGLTGAPTPHWGLLYDSNDVYLILGTDAFNLAGAAQTVNQRNTAGGVSSLGWGSPLFLTLAAQDASAQQAAFDQASGEFNASQQAALSNDSRFVREQMNKRLRDGDADDSAAKVDGTKLTAWVHGWGHWGQIDGDGNAAQMSDNGDGLLVGADLPVGASGRVGFTGGAERNSLSVHDRSSWADVTQTWLGTYGGFEQGAFAFRAGVAYAWNRIPAYRAVALPMMAPQTLSSNAIGNTTTGYIEGAWNIQTAAGKLAPYLNLANVRVHTDASNEAGGMAALHMDSASMDTSLSTLGVRGNWQLASKVALDANLGWVHAFGDITPERTQQFLAGGDAFTVYGTPLAQNAGQVNVNLTWQVAPNAQVVLGYDGLYGSSVKDTAAKASFNVAF
jgi:outer membrane autotransporter protein